MRPFRVIESRAIIAFLLSVVIPHPHINSGKIWSVKTIIQFKEDLRSHRSGAIPQDSFQNESINSENSYNLTFAQQLNQLWNGSQLPSGLKYEPKFIAVMAPSNLDQHTCMKASLGSCWILFRSCRTSTGCCLCVFWIYCLILLPLFIQSMVIDNELLERAPARGAWPKCSQPEGPRQCQNSCTPLRQGKQCDFGTDNFAFGFRF